MRVVVHKIVPSKIKDFQSRFWQRLMHLHYLIYRRNRVEAARRQMYRTIQRKGFGEQVDILKVLDDLRETVHRRVKQRSLTPRHFFMELSSFHGPEGSVKKVPEGRRNWRVHLTWQRRE